MRNIFIILMLFSSNLCALERQGIHYYDLGIPDTQSEHKSDTDKKTISSTDAMHKLQQMHTEALNTSILAPTKENILKERMLAIMFMNMAEKYQQNAQLVVNHTPAINYALKHPVDHASRKQHDALTDQKRDERVRILSKTHGLFFFYSGTCAHSAAFTPTIKRFASKYGFEVLPISIDGNLLPDFPDTVLDNGQAKALGVMHVPAVFAVNPHNNQAPILVGYGNLSVIDMVNNLDAHYKNNIGAKK